VDEQEHPGPAAAKIKPLSLCFNFIFYCITNLAWVFGFGFGFLQPAAAAVRYHYLAAASRIVGGSFLVGSFLAAVAGKVGSDLGVGIPN